MRTCLDLDDPLQLLSKLLTLYSWEGFRCRQDNVACDFVLSYAITVSIIALCNVRHIALSASNCYTIKKKVSFLQDLVAPCSQVIP